MLRYDIVPLTQTKTTIQKRKMTFDLLSTVGITADATVVVATFVALFGSSLTPYFLIIFLPT